MQRSVAMNLRQALTHRRKNQIFHHIGTRQQPNYDVFINHRGTDTKRSVASLLYDHLYQLKLRPFLDNKNMKPGDKLFEKIDAAITGCKIGVAVFSPRYCESYFCLHELALMMELKKKVIPIFCDVKPSELNVVADRRIPSEEAERFNLALEEAKYTVGLAFDSQKGNWSDVVKNTVDIVVESLIEVEDEEEERLLQPSNHFSYTPRALMQLQDPRKL
ncbi:TIR-only protein [Sesamum alatum]|uniref:TIR-only protein n=1 Tax=Sesamum alatum TaxID=300844 RepID=A0AAE1YZJ7_9LAMI|nr:TIR-only protein [Sesamum alatum]